MVRSSLVLIMLSLMMGCSTPTEQPLLSGLMWGGEGSRLVIKPAVANPAWTDTVLINHLGEFEWKRDSLMPGFYRLENSAGDGLMFFLERHSSVFVDAQYVTYPEGTKIVGSDIALDLLALEKNSERWLTELDTLTKRVHNPDWMATDANRKQLKADLDSVRLEYRNRALAISAKPLVRSVALMQYAGNNPLFNPWSDRRFFLEADSLLQKYRNYESLAGFFNMVDQIKHRQLIDRKIKPGDLFPEVKLPNQWGDSVALSRFRGTPVYVEVWNPSMDHNKSLHTSLVTLANKYRRQELEIYLVALDTVPATWKERIRQQNLYFYNVIDTSGQASSLINELGILQLPANFILDGNGRVVAKNVWDQQLEKSLGLLLKK